LASDLASFIQYSNSDAKSSNLTIVPVGGGQPSQDFSDFAEACLDTQWAAGIAPGAKIRVYVASMVDITYMIVVCNTVLNEGIDTVFTTSIGTSETDIPVAFLQSTAQLFAQMSAAGITVLCFAGDSGAYGLTANSMPIYPATDPTVTGVGGTTLAFDSNWKETSETVWSQTGGGYSTVFAQPSWQSGPGVPSGPMRSVPDVSAPADLQPQDGDSGATLVVNGSLYGGVGTSLSTPLWAGFVAMINQARAKAGLPSLGLLAPRLYSLIGTSAFNSITVGNNGYPAGPGYNLSTGVGTPNLTALIPALTPVPPTISSQPVSQTVTSGGTVVFAVAAGGSPAPTYQWQWDNVPLVGATNARLVLSGNTTVAGNYTCTVVNDNASVTSSPAVLTITPTTNPGRLINLSILSNISTNLSMGFVMGGAGTSGNETLLIRAVGPSIGAGTVFNVSGILPDPMLTVVQQTNNTISFKNAGWGANQAAVMAADAATAAFPLTNPASADSALVLNLPSANGGYSATISGKSGDSGSALTEVYDDTSNYTAASTRLINLSCLTQIATGGTLDVGFVIGGSTAKTVLVRVAGPTLHTLYGIAGIMPDPQLQLSPLGTSTVLTANAGWGGDPQLAAAAAAVGAYTWPGSTSLDSAALITLEPGPYTVQINSVSGLGGAVLVELYEVP